MNPEIHALLPRLSSKAGHIYHYHLAVQGALEAAGWEYHAYIPKRAEIASLPKKWIRCLANDLLQRRKTVRETLGLLLANVRALRPILSGLEHNRSAIVFIEHFELHHLVSIAMSLLFLRPKFQFWILHRYNLDGNWLKRAFHRWFHRFMRWKLGNTRVKCLTDSELLMEGLERDLGFPYWVVPIPHTEQNVQKETKQGGPIQLWWPGVVREDKGLHKIRYLLEQLQGLEEVQIVMGKEGEQFFGAHPKVHFTPTYLPKEEYFAWMQRADLLLFPYSGKTYAESTSGPFVESVSIGAIPVVSQGTWMAHELCRFDLSELVLNWDESDLIDRLMKIRSDSTIRAKLDLMKSAYCDYHSPAGFFSVISQIESTHS